ncbi:aspartate kinase [Photobacterium gaetbulicola]|uniref:Aspartokinase n=1 Tax=Photobacterium gaetbulicola Gung47 TaxID=658445 RepID=A0A0C5W7P7_9GAMM|nr:aspartate kinase [Photobacterium gaetbulicola]AJR07566.1 aspartate kinase [Photobacterium gaetbulicola Gung47]PSU04474.1 aspartate kinase [Photobacterium gaetbulicola]
MALLVQKFGGTSVGSIERIEAVAERVIKARQLGHQVVVVVSAMAGETNRLLGLAKQIDAVPTQRELDVLLSTGEQVTIALLAMALNQKGYLATSLTGDQLGIRTDAVFNNATITVVETEVVTELLERDHIVVVAGFQGRDSRNNITTLGRGGSDTTAVAIAGALAADECQIFTDVDGVYTTDPRLVSEAARLSTIHFDDMTAMARHGAKVLQLQSVEYAERHQVPLRVLSSFDEGEGTLVDFSTVPSEGAAGVAVKGQQALYRVAQPLEKVEPQLGLLGFDAWCYGDSQQATYIVAADDELARLNVIFEKTELAQPSVATLTLVGEGVEGNSAKVAALLTEKGVGVYQQKSAARCVSLLINGQDLQLAVEHIHKKFVVEPESLDNRPLLAVS